MESPPRTAGRASQAIRRAVLAETASPVGSNAAPRPLRRSVSRMVTTTVVGSPPVLGRPPPVQHVAARKRRQISARASAWRSPRVRGSGPPRRPAAASRAVEGGVEECGGLWVKASADPGPAVPVRAQREVATVRPGLLTAQGLAEEAVGLLGGDDVEDVTTEARQVHRVEDRGLLDEMCLGFAARRRVHRRRQCLDRAHDDAGLFLAHPSVGQRSARALVLCSQGLRQPDRTSGGHPFDAAGLAQPRGRPGRPGLDRSTGRLRRADELHPQPGQPGLQGHHGGEQFPDGLGNQAVQGNIAEPVEGTRDRCSGGGDRVHPGPTTRHPLAPPIMHRP